MLRTADFTWVTSVLRSVPAGTDRGDIVLGWLTKVVVVLALAGLVVFDTMAVAVAHVSAQDDANTAAMAASDVWHAQRGQHDLQAAYNAAAGAVEGKGESVLTAGFTIDPDGTVHLRLRKQATTLMLYRLGGLKKYATVTVSGEGKSLAS